MIERFHNRVALITGSGDVGVATALRFLEESCKVALFDFNAAQMESLRQNELKDFGPDRVLYITGDVTKLEDCERAVNETVAAFGKVDICFATAGIARHHPIDEMSTEDWNSVIAVNLTGTFNIAKAVVPEMKKNEYGRIVFVSSLGGRTGRPGVGVNYAASKAGVVGMTMLLGYELGPWNITVNAIAPGPLVGRMTKSFPPEMVERLKAGARIYRLGEMSEIAAAACYLASDEASWTTGEVLDVNGGLFY